jgi:hypothetical protein
MKTTEQIIESLSLVPKDIFIAVSEDEYLPIGEMVNEARNRIVYLNERIKILEGML